MTYKEFSDRDYPALQSDLLYEKGSDLQKTFLDAARDDGTFIQWIEDRVKLGDEGDVFELWADRLSEDQYKRLPKADEKELFEKWKNLTPAQASHGTFWGYVTLEHIKHGRIEATDLATSKGDSPRGKKRIEQVLSSRQKEPEVPIDKTVRAILRRLSGLFERGARSVYSDCPFARAWWRGYTAHQVHTETGADLDRVVKVLTVSPDYWERLIVLIVSRNSVLGDNKIRTALIWELSERISDENNANLFSSSALKTVSRQIGRRAALRELGVFDVGEIKEEIMKPIVSRVLETERKIKDQKAKDKADA